MTEENKLGAELGKENKRDSVKLGNVNSYNSQLSSGLYGSMELDPRHQVYMTEYILKGVDHLN